MSDAHPPDDAERSFWRDRPVLVTGATGFLGSHLTGLLVDAGAEVVVLVRDHTVPTSVRCSWLGRVARVRGDVCDEPLLERVLGEYGVDTVFHLAAQTQVAVANRNPGSTFESNIRGTWSILEAARRSPLVAQVVVASSDKAYGAQPSLPYSEEMPLLAVHPYDVSKACGDLLASSYHEVYDLPVCVTRCGNLFGPGDVNWDRLVPGVIRAVLRDTRPIIRSDGTAIRDYLYVEDGARAYLTLAEAMAEHRALCGEAFNFSTESPMAVLDLVRRICELAGRPDLEPDVRASATHEIAAQHLSADKAHRLLGWWPGFTFDDAVQHTVSWYREQSGNWSP